MKLLKTETTVTTVLELLLWGMEEGKWHVEDPRLGLGQVWGMVLMLCHVQYQGVEVTYVSAEWGLALLFMLRPHSGVLHSVKESDWDPSEQIRG